MNPFAAIYGESHEHDRARADAIWGQFISASVDCVIKVGTRFKGYFESALPALHDAVLVAHRDFEQSPALREMHTLVRTRLTWESRMLPTYPRKAKGYRRHVRRRKAEARR